MNHLLKLKPIFRETLWGGAWLQDEFGYAIPSRHTGECWAISAHPEGDCVVTQGSFKGFTLSSLFATHKELFADDPREKFPLLVKLIDAAQDLSVQVHPDDAYAQTHEHQPGKTEAWIVLKAQQDSRIELGHHAQTREELSQMIAQKQWDKLLSYRPITKNEAILVPSGTVHALCQGTAVLEIQQSSDVTYRFYDYDRVDAFGKPRQLHLEKAMDVVQVPQPPMAIQTIDWTKAMNALTPILECPYFKVSALTVENEYSLKNPQGSYLLISVLSGFGKAGNYHMKKGDHFVLTSLCDKIRISGRFKLIIVDPIVPGLSSRGGFSRGL